MGAFFSGSLDPFWPHVMLLSVAIAASFAVAVGIVLENPKWSLSNVLVVGGVAIEAVCTLLLFGFDEGISQSQQSKIIAMEARPWAKAQFDAIQEVKGQVTDVGVSPEKDCLECRMFADHIELALHSAGVRIHGDDSLDWMRGTGIMVWLPQGSNLVSDPLIKALSDAGLNPGATHHNPPEWSQVRTDIPVIFVGERWVPFSSFPYSPNGQAQWAILPLRNSNFVAPNPSNDRATKEMHFRFGPKQ